MIAIFKPKEPVSTLDNWLRPKVHSPLGPGARYRWAGFNTALRETATR